MKTFALVEVRRSISSKADGSIRFQNLKWFVGKFQSLNSRSAFLKIKDYTFELQQYFHIFFFDYNRVAGAVRKALEYILHD